MFSSPIEVLEDADTFFYQFQRELENETSSDEDSSDLWFVGVILYATGAFFMALGVVLQKYSINKEFERTTDVALHRSKVKQPFWVSGIVLYGSSGGLLSAALGFAPQSLLTPLMSVVIISNALLGRFLLYEPVTERDVKCILVIVVSVMMTTLSAPSTDTKPSTEELIELYKKVPFIGYVIFLTGLMWLFYYHNYVGIRKNNMHEIMSTREEFYFSFSYGASAGCWGGLSVTMMKSGINIVADKYDTEGIGQVFTTPLMYGLIAVLVMCWFQQLSWINKGLERFPAVFVVSIEAVLNKVVAVMGGILYFEEYKNFSLLQAAFFILGLCLGVTAIITFALRDNMVGPDQDFFTNASYLNCCSGCNLPQDNGDIEGDVASRKSSRKSVKTVLSGGELVYVDDNGQEVRVLGEEDYIFYERVDSPTTVLANGFANGAGFLYSTFMARFAASFTTEEDRDEENGRVRRRSSDMRRMRRTASENEVEPTLTGRLTSYVSSWIGAAEPETKKQGNGDNSI